MPSSTAGWKHAYNGAQKMIPREFDHLVEKALQKIPARFRKRLGNVVFVVEQEPPSPNLLGLYQGRPLTMRQVGESFTMPDRITIFQGPHERLARNRRQLEMLLEDTVWHEVAHYFGMDEKRVRMAERQRKRGAYGLPPGADPVGRGT
jgi:predicted Zn-dependent protease with MMP-like domain